MGKRSLSDVATSIQKAMKKHSPELLTGIGIAGMITTTVMAVRATPKALDLLEKEKERQNQELLQDSNEKGDEECAQITKLKSLDIVKTTWICYIPAVVTGCVSILCLTGASSVNAKRNAALATAYTLSESALKEYTEKVVETIGEKKEQSIRDAIAKDKIDNNPVGAREIIITNKGDTLCYDAISGRYFKSDIEKIKKAVNEMNRQMLSEMYFSLNDFYHELGLSNTSIGEELGWNINRDGLLDLRFSSQLTEDGTPCLVIDYHVPPRYDYQYI